MELHHQSQTISVQVIFAQFLSRGRPAPGWRIRADAESEVGSRSSLSPPWMVVRDNPVAVATAAMPPRPRLLASQAAQRRHTRSFISGANRLNFAWMAAIIS